MKLDPLDPSLRTLLASPSPATLTLYREGGRAMTSPVWFQVQGDWFEFVVAANDRKLDLLRADPRCSLLVFEAVKPFRGVQVTGEATIVPDDGARTRLAPRTASSWSSARFWRPGRRRRPPTGLGCRTPR